MPVSSPKEPCTLYKQLLKTEIKLIIPRLARWVIAAESDLKQTDGTNVVIWVYLAGYSHPCWKKSEFSLETSHDILRLDSNIFCSFWYRSNCTQEEWGTDLVDVWGSSTNLSWRVPISQLRILQRWQREQCSCVVRAWLFCKQLNSPRHNESLRMPHGVSQLLHFPENATGSFWCKHTFIFLVTDG